MIKIKREEVEIKSNSELLKDFHESRFHHKDYISTVISILLERGFTKSTLFDNKTTDELVVLICFEIDKHNEEYIQLVKEELENRNYNLNSIPDIKNKETFSSHINASAKLNNTSKVEKKTTRSTYIEDEVDVLIEEKKSNNYSSVIIALVIIGIIKLGLMYVRNKDEKNSKEQINKIEVLLYGEDGILKTKINAYKNFLDSIKYESPSFVLSQESKNDITKTEIVEVEKTLSKYGLNKNEIFVKYSSDFLNRFKTELESLLDSYTETESEKNTNNSLNNNEPSIK